MSSTRCLVGGGAEVTKPTIFLELLLNVVTDSHPILRGGLVDVGGYRLSGTVQIEAYIPVVAEYGSSPALVPQPEKVFIDN
jgi:hypothetical protein